MNDIYSDEPELFREEIEGLLERSKQWAKEHQRDIEAILACDEEMFWQVVQNCPDEHNCAFLEALLDKLLVDKQLREREISSKST